MDDIKILEEKLNNLISELKEEFMTLRTNRPTPKLIENIQVNYMEQSMPIIQLGSIGIELPKSLIVTPWDNESSASIAKAIEGANLGVSVAVQGAIIRVTLPDLTSERREELGKIVKTTTEQIRIKMRTLRDDVNKKVSAEADEDLKFRMKDELQKTVDKFNKGIDDIVETKLQELSG